MNLIPWQNKRNTTGVGGGNPLAQFRNEMDRIFDRFVGGWPAMSLATPGHDWFGDEAAMGWAPPVDIAETPDEVVVKAELPGVEPKDLNVSVTGSTLTLSGQKEDTREEDGNGFFRSERRFGSFQRSIPLPEYANPESVNAEFDNGVLTVHIQKSADIKPRQIAVKAGNGKSRR